VVTHCTFVFSSYGIFDANEDRHAWRASIHRREIRNPKQKAPCSRAAPLL
jgi:hypothetical protein